MPAITLKALPVSLHRTLKHRAARHQRSLNQEVISLLQEAVSPARPVDVEAMLAETRRLRDSLRFKTTPAEIDAFKGEGRA
jgi:plasmid stability protein